MAHDYSQYLAPLPVKQKRILKEDYVYQLLLVDPKTAKAEKLTVTGFEELYNLKLGNFKFKYSLEEGGEHRAAKSTSLQSNLKRGRVVTYRLPDHRIAHVRRIK